MKTECELNSAAGCSGCFTAGLSVISENSSNPGEDVPGIKDCRGNKTLLYFWPEY